MKTRAVVQKSRYGKFIRTFDSLTEAAFHLTKKKDATHIADCCAGRRATAYGYCWEYLDETSIKTVELVMKGDEHTVINGELRSEGLFNCLHCAGMFYSEYSTVNDKIKVNYNYCPFCGVGVEL